MCNGQEEKFMVTPICCTTYHYAVKVLHLSNKYSDHFLWPYDQIVGIFSVLHFLLNILAHRFLPLHHWFALHFISQPILLLIPSSPSKSIPRNNTCFHAHQVKYNDLLCLSEELVQLCIDDRTIDFTLALLDFVKWDRDRSIATCKKREQGGDGADDNCPPNIGEEDGGSSITNGSSSSSSSSCASKSHYQWPSFIISMLNKPTEWASWRKKVERSILSNREPGKPYYI